MPAMIRRLSTSLVLAVAVLATVAATSVLAAPRAHSAVRWTATLTASGHHPKARKRWPVKIVVKTSGGKPVSGTVQYHFLFNGTVVGTRSCLDHGTAPCPFRGTYRDILHFPMAAVGHPLTLQFVIKTRFGTKNINYAITVVK
jgi:hypothetical protein